MGQQKTKIIGSEIEGTQKKTDIKSFKKSDKQNDNRSIEKVENKTEAIKKNTPKDESVSRKRNRFPRSRKYLLTREEILKNVKNGDLSSALNYLLEKFPKQETIDLAINLTHKKGQDPIRKVVSLPSGLVKTPKIAICNEDLLAKLEKGIVDFDVLISSPTMMPKLAKFAKLLGPKGLMPNPKSGTVTEKPENAKKELSSGNVEIKQDKTNIIHISVGKVEWGIEKVSKNIEAVIKEVPSNRIVSIFISSSQSPSLKIR